MNIPLGGTLSSYLLLTNILKSYKKLLFSTFYGIQISFHVGKSVFPVESNNMTRNSPACEQALCLVSVKGYRARVRERMGRGGRNPLATRLKMLTRLGFFYIRNQNKATIVGIAGNK